MVKDRQKVKGRKTSGSFIQIPHAILEHENYARLSARAVKALLDIYGQYKGKNNGDLCCALSVMKKRGWTSKDQLQKGKIELLETGWIVETKLGGRGIGPHLYAVTFKPIDDCSGKLDRPATRTALGYWKLGHNPELTSLPRDTD